MSAELLTKHQLAVRLQCSLSMIRRLVAEEKIPEVILSRRIHRFDLAAVMEALKSAKEVKTENK